jgi:hypothetical protein
MDKVVNPKLIDAAIEQMKVDMKRTIGDRGTFVRAFEKLKSYLPEDEEEDDAEQARYTLAEGRFNALVHWEKCFLDGTLDDEHAEFIAGVLAKARKEVADNFYQACENDMHRKLTKEQD